MDIICLVIIIISLLIMVVNIIQGIKILKKYEETFDELDKSTAMKNMKLAIAFSIISIVMTVIFAIISLAT